MTVGYSGKSLVQKLGIKADMKIYLLGVPKGFDYGDDFPEVQMKKTLKKPIDFIHVFTAKLGELEEKFPKLKEALDVKGMLWISWPKKSAKTETDLNENIVRDIGLKHGLVDVKVCAVNETWSGLKFVYRLTDRKK